MDSSVKQTSSALSLKVIHDSLRRETPGNHCGRHSRAGMRARSGEIHIVVTRMFIARAEISELHDVMAKSVRGAFHQVIALAPGERREVDLKFDVRFEIVDSQ